VGVQQIRSTASTPVPALLNVSQLGSDRQTNWTPPPNILGSGPKLIGRLLQTVGHLPIAEEDAMTNVELRPLGSCSTISVMWP
jgi:hypothetical protein